MNNQIHKLTNKAKLKIKYRRKYWINFAKGIFKAHKDSYICKILKESPVNKNSRE